MTLNPGMTLGAYEIVSLLGKGGMGEVPRVRDPRLKRDVAVKVLPPEFSANAERAARFRREAVIHHVEQLGESQLLVLELVEGEALADKIARGPLPIEDALSIANKVAEAMEAAGPDQHHTQLV